MRSKFVKKFIKLIKITNCVCVAVYATVVTLLWCALCVYTLSAHHSKDLNVCVPKVLSKFYYKLHRTTRSCIGLESRCQFPDYTVVY